MPSKPPRSRPLRWVPLGALCALAGLSVHCHGEPAGERVPFTPPTDDVVLERVPPTASDGRARERARLRRELDANPGQLERAVRLARLDIEEGRARGDPRYLGRAQGALAPWWDAPEPPFEVRVLRATIHQGRHEFDAALADLDVAVRENPGSAQAWLTRAVVLGVRGDHAEAARSCAPLEPLAGALTAAVCRAQVRSLAGHSREAYALLSGALARGSGLGDPGELAWVLSTLGEAAARAGDTAQADRLLSRALALDGRDAYTRAAYADLLLDTGRAREAVELVRDHTADDAQLLRRVLAETALGSPEAPALADELAARFAASRLRGDGVHAREEARFALHVERDASKALALAQANWRVQHEPWDARVLLEAALAAGQPEAARPVLRFLEASGCEDPGLVALAERARRAAP